MNIGSRLDGAGKERQKLQIKKIKKEKKIYEMKRRAAVKTDGQAKVDVLFGGDWNWDGQDNIIPEIWDALTAGWELFPSVGAAGGLFFSNGE